MIHANPSQYIATLDPDDDYEEIVRLLQTVVFRWDTERALEFALFRTYAVPSISGLLAATGQFTQHTRKRYDDTELLLAEAVEHGLDSERGGAAIARMNDMHGRYKISNDNYLYVLSSFVFQPIRWMDQYAWRPMTDLEKRAWFNYYSALGQRMKIQELPDSFEAFEQFNLRYERKAFRYSRSNGDIAHATKMLFLSFYLPKRLYGLASPFFDALLEPPLLAALGFKQPSSIFRCIMHAGLKFRALCLKCLPKNRTPVSFTGRQRPTYPMGYAIDRLGTFEGGITATPTNKS
jgi:hypothetical protein